VPKILIVDDHAPNLLALEAVLEPLGNPLVRAASGEEALARLKEGDFALILLDVQMPGMDGFETATVIKSDADTACIPIIFITAMNRELAHVFRGYAHGAVDYLLKPFEPEILRSKVSVFIDLHLKTEQVRTQAKLLREHEVEMLERRSEQRYRGLADSLPMPMCAARPDGSVYYANRAWVDYSGFDIEETTTVTNHENVHAEDLQAVREAWAGSIDTGKSFEVEYRVRRRGESRYRWHLARGVPERDDRGTIDGWIVTAADIDEQKTGAELRARLLDLERDARAKAEASNTIKDEFLATLSHEIRTPLHAVLGWVQLLRGGDLDAETGEQALEAIERNAETQARLIEDLLDISSIVTGKTKIDVKVVNLHSVIAAAADTLLPAARAKKIRFEFALDDVAELAGDPVRLQQIVWNLLSNAVKFGTEGGRIVVRLAEVGSNVELQVSDDGKGIPSDFLPFAFDRFRQAESTATRQHGGLGLGLAIVSHLVSLHGGTVKAESEGVGKGTTFIVRLPFRRSSERLRVSVPIVSDETDLDGVRVLVVDDDADARKLLTTALVRCGADVRTAASVEEALVFVRQLMPDVIVSDIGMPDEDGYALMEQVTHDAARLGIPCPSAIAVTALARAEDRARALRAGFQSHIAKPVNPTELALVVASLVPPAPGRALGI
jgi:PAS domain S-box-containing protein